MQCLNFNYSLLGVSVNVFRNLFLIFDLDMQHPVLLENYRCLSSYGSLLPLVLVYTHVCVGAFTRTPFFRSCLVDSTLQQKEHLWDAWLYFPGTKVGPNRSLLFSFWLFGGFDYESLLSTIIPGGWLGLFSLVVFCLLGKGSLHISFV
jgi:hypothetical protein